MLIIGIAFVVFIFIVFLLLTFLRTYHDEYERIKHLLNNEVGELEKLSFEDLEKLCSKEPQKEVLYDDQKFVRLIATDLSDDDKFLSLHVQVTICGRMFKSLRESARFVKERKLILNKD